MWIVERGRFFLVRIHVRLAVQHFRSVLQSKNPDVLNWIINFDAKMTAARVFSRPSCVFLCKTLKDTVTVPYSLYGSGRKKEELQSVKIHKNIENRVRTCFALYFAFNVQSLQMYRCRYYILSTQYDNIV